MLFLEECFLIKEKTKEPEAPEDFQNLGKILRKVERFREVMCGWSWEENKLFEVALAVVDEQHPERWQVVAAMVGGDKSAEDVEKHYVILVEDLQVIESGKFDHEFGHQLQSGGAAQSVFWTDEDSNLLVQLNLN